MPTRTSHLAANLVPTDALLGDCTRPLMVLIPLAGLPRPSFLGALAVASFLLGCSPQAPPNAASAPATSDTVWYVSVRARDNGRDTRRLADSLEYGMVVSSVQSDGDPLTHDFDTTPVDSVRLTSSTFATAVRARAREASADDPLAVLMVHGFGTSLHEAWDYAAQSHIRSSSQAPWVVFCWPSNGSGVAWPRADQILTRAYREDSVAATASRAAFSQALQALLSAFGGTHLLLVSHSMGAQLVGEALVEDPALRTALAADQLRALAFFAPDVAVQHFNDFTLPAVLPLAERVVIYASSDDRMLTLSRAINHSERAGLIRGTPAGRAGVETVDVTAGISAENRAHRMLGTHHGIRRESAALFDMMQIVAARYTASCRATLGTALLDPAGVWKLTAMPPPPLTAFAACSRDSSG